MSLQRVEMQPESIGILPYISKLLKIQKKGRIDMQPLLRIFRFCNPQRKRVYEYFLCCFGWCLMTGINAH